MSLRHLALLLCSIFITVCINAQSVQHNDSTNLYSSFPLSYFDEVSSKTNAIEEKLDKKSQKVLQQLQKQEEKIKRRLAKTDSAKAAAIFGDADQQYKQLEQRLENTTGQYFIPSLDTLGTSLHFLQQNHQLLSTKSAAQQKLKDALDNVKGLGTKFKKAEEIKNFLKQRKQYLKEQLNKLGGKYTKQLKQINKQAYYYSEQLSEYKAMLKDHKKAGKKALTLLSKTKPFKDFMRKNSQLASMFRLPADPDDPVAQVNLSGLQTRAQVNGMIQQQLGIGGPNAQQQFSQNVQQAQSQLSKLKDKALKISSFGGGSGEEADGFKPNSQRTKSFLKRLEFGTNIQSQKARGYFPVTTDIGLSVGYKLNDKSIIGIGASYKLGLGRDIRHIDISHQGLGVRSFVDWKIRSSFWLTGGYEMNYRNEFNSIDVLKDLNAWQQSGLIGLSKKISLKTKFFKNTKLQLLWDFMSYQQLPRTQPVIFRIGYSF